MKKLALYTLSLLILAVPAQAAPDVGKMAPDFTVTDIKGQAFKLSGQKGKYVVLEWTNHQCPFVVNQYGTGNMQKIQKTVTDDGGVWVTIVSSAPGLQGHVMNEEAQKIMDEAQALPTHKVLDESGAIGTLYGAKTTPHMFVIDKDGTLAYAGAIDDHPTPKAEGLDTAKNYVLAALADLKAARPVATSQTEAYGCSVKYAH
ncbi:MAG: redoxin domain-containing protein [Alphaproteobacteria bacterium]